jgi:hypothetical protein
MSEISRKVREAVLLRLSDPTSGFNANLAAVASTYGIQPFSVDWSATSKNFFRGFLDPNDVDESTPSRYPLVMMYAITSTNRNLQKFALFSGEVILGLDFHITWRAGNALRNFEDLGDAIEDAVYKTLNGTDFQAWGAPLTYNGQISLAKRPLELAGEHWRQTLSFRLTLQVDTN